jgi:putative ABC transport system substrate-binding protein
MNRRRFVLTSLAGALPTSRTAGAQPPRKVHQVGIVTLGSPPPQSALWQGFIDAMRDLGYVERRNLVLRLALADGRPDRLPGLVAGLLQAKVDAIATTSIEETRAAKRATSTIPIVMTLVPDPVGAGLVASLARPGGNVTGLTNLVPGVNQKYVELLKQAVPSASRLVVVAIPGRPFPEIRRELEGAARRLGTTVSYAAVTTADDFDPVLAGARQGGDAAIIVPLGALTYAHRQKLVQVALKHRLPGIYWDRGFVEAGGLMTYSASLAAVGRRAAYFVDRVLQGTPPADLPVEQPAKFELVINLKAAKALGLEIPQSLQLRADHVID